MLKQLLTYSLLALVPLIVTACKDKEEEPPPVTGPNARPAATPEPPVAYTQGFYDLEQDGALTWRWMSDTGIVRLKNTNKDMKLRIVGHAPAEELKGTVTLRISLNGEKLEEFSAKGDVQKEYVIAAAKQGSAPASELVITANKSFVPKELNAKSNDTRKLSISVSQVVWQEK